MVIVHFFIAAILTVILLTVFSNRVYLRRKGRTLESASFRDAPLVSVLIPARNEAARLGPCLESLALQDYPNIEVLVLDDCSEDGTRELAISFEGRVPELRVLDGKPLPPGWAGKPHACAQLAEAARGEWLLFTDADVVHGRESVSRGIAAARALGADLLTLFTGQRLGTFAEGLTIPFLYFIIAGFISLFVMERSRLGAMAAANGQYMLFSRRAYDAVGGHKGVAGDLVEDVALARAIRRSGLNMVVVNGVEYTSVRMYTGWADVVEGFSKNFFAGLGNSVRNLAILVAIWFGLFVLPPGGLVWALATGEAWGWFALEVGLVLTTRLMLAGTFRQPVWSAFLHPLAVLVFLGIGLRSCWLTLWGGGVRWKGRLYGNATNENRSSAE